MRTFSRERLCLRPAYRAFDFLVASTGILNDLSLRSELKNFVPDMAVWRDCPAPQDKRNANIEAMPCLGPGVSADRAYAEAGARLHGLFVLNYSALASLGLFASALSGIRYALPRLVEGVAIQLFLDDRAAILTGYFGYVEEEFTEDRS
jgi:hypothetical protein